MPGALEASDILLGVVGKTNVGKSTFFAAATELSVEIENRPFTTIDPNVGIAYVRTRCAHVRLGLPKCDAANSVCIDGYRYVPVRLMDVAGLVPGAHEGRGLGNRFLDHLRRADALLLVVDASGATSPEGVPMKPGTFDPVEEVKLMIYEIEEWMYGIIRRDWEKFAKAIDVTSSDIPGSLAQRLSGLSIRKEHVVAALEKTGLSDKKLSTWTDEELRGFVRELRRVAKPILVVANKADIPEAEDNIKRMERELTGIPIVPTSAAAELALRRAARAGLIRYRPGDPGFEIVDESRLTERQKAFLKAVDERVFKKWGGTGVQEALNKIVFDVLGYIVVYPVEDVNKYTDKQGRILPDALLVPRGYTARQLAYKIHTDLGRTFLYAINAYTKQRIGESYILEDGDVVRIVAAAAKR